MNFFSSKSGILMTAVILILTILCVVLGYTAIGNSNKYKDLESQIEQLNSDNTNLSDKMSSAEQENSSLKSSVDDLESQNNSLKQENSALQKQNSDLKKENSSLKYTPTSKKSTVSVAPQNNAKPTEKGKVCYLTFDDGPSDNTLKIIDILAEYNAKATFFVVGTSKLQYIKNIHEAGHAVGLHANVHEYRTIYASEEAFLNDLNAISAKVEQYTGQKSMITRFPGGSSNTASKFNKGIMTRLTQLLPSMGYAYFDWNVDSTDALGSSVATSKIVNNVVNGAKNQNVICVLFHDAAGKATTVKALPEILKSLSDMGFEFRALTTDSYGFHHGVNN